MPTLFDVLRRRNNPAMVIDTEDNADGARGPDQYRTLPAFNARKRRSNQTKQPMEKKSAMDKASNELPTF